MFIQSSTSMNTQKLPWHPPKIVEEITLSPPAGQLSLSGHTWRYMMKNRDEHEAELSKARVAKMRALVKAGLAECTVVYNGDILDMLVGMGQILDAETEDSKEVGKAISEMLAEVAQIWKAEGSLPTAWPWPWPAKKTNVGW